MADARVSEFYDRFSDFQQRVSFNERHYLLLDKLLEAGLKASSHVLELGCGIGIMSSLILGVTKKGRLAALDISAKSIELARRRNPASSACFEVCDLTQFSPNRGAFDLVTLFDVLEHVPVESHHGLFAAIADSMRDDGRFLVNIPNPDYLRYLRQTRPETLQIIDQPLSIPKLLASAEMNGLVLRSLVHYDLWHRNESVFMWFEKSKPFLEIETKAPRPTLLRRLQNRLRFYW